MYNWLYVIIDNPLAERPQGEYVYPPGGNAKGMPMMVIINNYEEVKGKKVKVWSEVAWKSGSNGKKSLGKVEEMGKSRLKKWTYSLLIYFRKDSGLEVDFVIRYKGECVLLEVKAKDGNAKSTRTRRHDDLASLHGDVSVTAQSYHPVLSKLPKRLREKYMAE
ncbi:MAG: hypothetical protein ACI4T9_12685 [Prevotella sp.]